MVVAPPLLLLLLAVLPSLAFAQTDEYGLLNALNFSWGTFSIISSYVALISICVGSYRVVIDVHPVFSATDETLAEARKACWFAALEAIGVFTVLIIAMAIVVPILTRPLDPRMVQIIEGFSQLLSSVILGMLSLRVAIWIGLYGHPLFIENPNLNVGTTIVELKHRVRWSVCKRFLRTFFCLLILFQGGDAKKISLSLVFGLIFGIVVDFFVALGRRLHWGFRRTFFSIAFVATMIGLSIAQLTFGVFFIASVWESNVEDVYDTTWDGYALLFGVMFLPTIHILCYCLGKKNMEDRRNSNRQSSNSNNNNEENFDSGDANDPKQAFANQKKSSGDGRARMATSMFFSDMKLLKKRTSSEKEKNNNNDAIIEEGDEEESESNNNNPQPKPPAGGVEEPLDDEDVEANTEEDVPTLTELMSDWTCCGCARGNDKTCVQKAANTIIWILYLAMIAVSLLSLVCNAGSTYQQERVRRKLPFVTQTLYTDMNEGVVCAFDDRGADSNITTFASKDAAHDAGFLVVHCGACAACSNWENLRLEYTTRNFLAAESKDCAQSSLFGGGDDALLECLKEPKIGFQGRCAECWQEDIICTKKFCWAIGLQSFFINTLSNFAVGPDTITSATCEEANCEAGNPGLFVPCSGANRRRMNVKSTIERPKNMQCTIVDVEWSELFPDPHWNDPKAFEGKRTPPADGSLHVVGA